MLTALNLLPSIATLALDSRPISRQSATKRVQTLADGRAVVLAEVRDGLVIGHKPAGQPHEFDVARRLPLQPPARLHTVEIAVDVELEQHRRMIGGPPRRLRHDAVEPKVRQSERVHKGVDHANGVILVDPVVQALREQGRLTAIRTRHKAPHPIP